MKSKKSDNALVHGLYAREVVLPWEDSQIFAAFLAAIRQELNPIGPLEEEAARDVAELHWRKQRLAISYLLQFHKNAPPPELIEAAKGGLAGLAAYLAEGARRSPGILTATASQVIDYIKSGRTADSAGGMTGSSQGQGISVRSVVEQAYDPTAMERYLKTEAMIDARIAKILGRLVCLKEYKKIYGHATIQPLPVVAAPTLLPAASSCVEPPNVPPESDSSSTKKRKWGDPE